MHLILRLSLAAISIAHVAAPAAAWARDGDLVPPNPVLRTLTCAAALALAGLDHVDDLFERIARGKTDLIEDFVLERTARVDAASVPPAPGGARGREARDFLATVWAGDAVTKNNPVPWVRLAGYIDTKGGVVRWWLQSRRDRRSEWRADLGNGELLVVDAQVGFSPMTNALAMKLGRALERLEGKKGGDWRRGLDLAAYARQTVAHYTLLKRTVTFTFVAEGNTKLVLVYQDGQYLTASEG